ncbi:hypothetical protein CPC08DRAFT_766847 [Agrocybe pediades]|nr:hypothetical protein CPC08DRAFT_766847 [Agrocybe pediades]
MSPPIQLNSDTAAPSAASADDMASFDEYNVASVHLADANDVYRAHLDDRRETLKHEASIAADSASKAAHAAAQAAALATNSLSAAKANDAAAAATAPLRLLLLPGKYLR